MLVSRKQFGTSRLPRRVPAWAVMEHADPNDWNDDSSEQEFWDRKLDRSKKSGLYKSISKKGVKEPIVLMPSDESGRAVLLSGHHRVAAAYDIDPNTPLPMYYYGRDTHTY